MIQGKKVGRKGNLGFARVHVTCFELPWVRRCVRRKRPRQFGLIPLNKVYLSSLYRRPTLPPVEHSQSWQEVTIIVRGL